MVIGKISSGEIATWVTGGATVLLFVIAFVSLFLEQRYRKNREKRQQAEKLSCWISGINYTNIGPNLELVIINNSDQPIYSLIITLGASSYIDASIFSEISSINTIFIGVLPPGKIRREVENHVGGMHKQPIIQYAFTDVMGYHWLREPFGKLVALNKPSYEYFNVSLPIPWNNQIITKIEEDPSL